MNRPAVLLRIIITTFFIAAMSASVLNVHAQTEGWSEEFRLIQETTLDDRVTTPDLVADGDDLYLVFAKNGLIHFKNSNDRGKTWSEPIQIAPDRRGSSAPTIALTQNILLVVWPSLTEVDGLTANQLYASESRDKGATWSAPRRITNTRDDGFSPRLLGLENRAILLWMETPLAETLGRISLQQRLAIAPEAVESLQQHVYEAGGPMARLRQVQASILSMSYNPATGSFTTRATIEQMSAQRLPYIFSLYGPIQNSFWVLFNHNTTLKAYQSTDGQNWTQNFQEREHFNLRSMFDIAVVDDRRDLVWIQRETGRQLPVMLRLGAELESLQLSPPQFVRSVPRIAFSDGDYHVVWEAGDQADSWISYMRSDDVPPTSTITAPDDPDITTRMITFQWQGEDNISSTSRLRYAYRLNEGIWSSLQSENQTTIPAPPDGDYVFQVRAEDVAGNIQNPPAEFAFNTYLSAPKTTLVDAPAPGTTIYERDFTLAFLMEDNNDAPDELEYSARVNDGEWTPFQLGASHTFQNLANGPHVLQIRARDSQGNIEEEPATLAINVSVGLDIVLSVTPEIFTNEDTVTLAWEATDSDGAPVLLESYYYALNDAQPVELSGISQVELEELEEGAYEIVIWGRDASGDETPRIAHSWVIDRTPPNTHAEFTGTYNAGFPVIRLSASDPPLSDGSGGDSPTEFQYRINDGEWRSFSHTATNWSVGRRLPFYSWGFTVDIRAIDKAGNVDSSPATVDLRFLARTNPYILYTLLGLILVLIAFILKIVLSRFSQRRRPAVSPVASSDDSSEYSFGSGDSSDSSMDIDSLLSSDDDKKNE